MSRRVSSRAVSRTASYVGIAAGLGLGLAGCFDPQFRAPTCGPAGQCPDGFTCASGPGDACVATIALPDDGGSIDHDASATDATSADAASDVDASLSPCDLASPWRDIRPVAGINTAGDELNATLAADERTLVFTRRRAMGSRRAFRAPRMSLRWARVPRERTTRSAWSARTRPRRDVRCRIPDPAGR